MNYKIWYKYIKLSVYIQNLKIILVIKKKKILGIKEPGL